MAQIGWCVSSTDFLETGGYLKIYYYYPTGRFECISPNPLFMESSVLYFSYVTYRGV